MNRRPCLFRYATALHRAFQQFFAEVPGALKDHLNFEELSRIAVAALTAGGGVFGLLEAILRHAQAVFPAPADAALAAALLTLILEVGRRLQHGDDPAFLGSARRYSR